MTNNKTNTRQFQSLAEIAYEFLANNGAQPMPAIVEYAKTKKHIQDKIKANAKFGKTLNQQIYGKCHSQAKFVGHVDADGVKVWDIDPNWKPAPRGIPKAKGSGSGNDREFAEKLLTSLHKHKEMVAPQNIKDLAVLLGEIATGKEGTIDGTLARLAVQQTFADSKPEANDINDIVVTPAMERAVIEKMDSVREDEEVYDALNADGSNFYQELAYGMLDNDKSIDEQIAEVKEQIKAKKAASEPTAETIANAKVEGPKPAQAEVKPAFNATEKAKAIVKAKKEAPIRVAETREDIDLALELLSSGRANRKHTIVYEAGNGQSLRYTTDRLEKVFEDEEEGGGFKGYYTMVNENGILVNLMHSKIQVIELDAEQEA